MFFSTSRVRSSRIRSLNLAPANWAETHFRVLVTCGTLGFSEIATASEIIIGRGRSERAPAALSRSLAKRSRNVLSARGADGWRGAVKSFDLWQSVDDSRPVHSTPSAPFLNGPPVSRRNDEREPSLASSSARVARPASGVSRIFRSNALIKVSYNSRNERRFYFIHDSAILSPEKSSRSCNRARFSRIHSRVKSRREIAR